MKSSYGLIPIRTFKYSNFKHPESGYILRISVSASQGFIFKTYVDIVVLGYNIFETDKRPAICLKINKSFKFLRFSALNLKDN